jgi:protein involved in temperature-dependent protein secretion
VKNCLKKKNDEKERANQACEDQKQMFVATLGANDHTTYDWIIDSDTTEYMMFVLETT